MKINLSKQQYKDLLEAVAISNTINEILSDGVEGGNINYNERADRTGELQAYLLEFAEDAEMGETLLNEEGALFMDDDYFEEEIQPVIDDFEEFLLFDNLPNILAWRDFNRDYTDEELEKMEEENGNFFALELFPYEERYRNEFDEYGFERLFIKEDTGKGTPSPYL